MFQTKYHRIYELAQETAKKITGSAGEWMKYLSFAARLYRFPFADQVLIYAQRPDATACTSLKNWNEKMFCWVNRGAKGIALIDDKRDWPVLRYVFDVKDVHPAKRIGKKPYLWKLEQQQEQTVLERLEKIYGKTEESLPFESRIIELSMRIAGDYCEDMLPEVYEEKDGSFLDGLDELNILIQLRDTLSSSIAYTILSRCGVDMEIWKEELNFDYIPDFNTPKLVSVLGTGTSEITRPVLVEIGKAVTKYNRKKTLAKSEGAEYNYNQTNVREWKEEKENAVDLRKERGLSDSQPDGGRTDGTGTDEIREDAEELSEGTQKGNLQRDALNGRTDGALPYDSGAGRAENGISDSKDGGSGGRGRETESVQPDGLDRKDEQHPAQRRGERDSGTGLRIDSGEEPQAERTDAERAAAEEAEPPNGIQQNSSKAEPDSEEQSLSGSDVFLTVSKEREERIKKAVLCDDTHLLHKRTEIAGYFEMEKDVHRQEEYLKNAYPQEIYYGFGFEGISIGYYAVADGIHMNLTERPGVQNEITVLWKDVRYRVNSYIEDGMYLLPGEEPEHFETDGMYQQMDLFAMMEQQTGTIAVEQAERGKVTAPSVSKGMPQEWVDTILRSGGGKKENRRRIFAKYRQGKTPEEMTDFLRKEYGTTGKGFEFDGKQAAVWFDGDGMRAGYGTSAWDNPVVSMSWEEVESAIRRQVESGTYMSVTEAYLVDETERNRIARDLYFFFRDGMGKLPEEFEAESGAYPDAYGKIAELLSTPEGIALAAEKMDQALYLLETGEETLRFHSVVKKEDIRAELDNIRLPQRELPLADSVDVRQEDFITLDEIDYRLKSGSGLEHGLFRIYEYFMEGHDSKDTVDFLKNEYGTGGSYPALAGSDKSGENHDSKGILLEKGSITEPYTEILLSWRTVEKRIRKLIQEDKYLSPAQKEAYAVYKAEQENRALAQAQEKLVQTFETESGAAEYLAKIETNAEKQPLLTEEPAQDTQKSEQTLYSGDKMGLPYDIVVEKLHIEDLEKLEKTQPEQPQQVNSSLVEKESTENKPVAGNFRITDDALGTGTPKEKFRRNILAVRTLQQIESENRTASLQEQQILSQYVGWGGLADVFDETKDAWHGEYQELKGILSDAEYASARESTLNAHYTSPVIIRSIYEALKNMGFEKGNILEPAMGIGNFYGCLPESMQASRLYGVELDSLTGRIAKQLYPDADIQIKGFEKAGYPNDFFDVAVGNVPFGQYKVADKQYDKYNFLIHDYFFARVLALVRPGGIIAFVTSKGTMDKKSPAVRQYIAQRAEFLGAVRLPNTAFKANAGTDVTSDILFLKKRDRLMDVDPDWVHLSQDEKGTAMNAYFVEHPEMVLGTMEMKSGPYGEESTCRPDEGRPFEEQLREAIAHIDGRIEQTDIYTENEMPEETIPADPAVKNYSYTMVDGAVYYRENSVMVPSELSETMQKRIAGMIGIRDCTRELIDLQLKEYPEEEIQKKQRRLNYLYDEFSKKYGLINSRTNRRAFHQDSSYCLLCSLEKLDDEGNFVGKADMFTKRTIKKAQEITSVDTAAEALAVSLSERAKVDLDYMAGLLLEKEKYQDQEKRQKKRIEIEEELAGVIFKNPVTEQWETADEYLSGNVREKLETAETFAGNHPEYTVNVQALTKVQPKELDASEIEVRIGATWIEPHYIEDFMRDIFETPEQLFQRKTVAVLFSDVTGEWRVKGKNADYGNSLTNSTYGSERRNGYQILEDSLNLKDSRVYDTIMEDGKEKRVLNKKETMIASQKQEMIREAFRDWIFRDQERREVLVGRYNKIFNSNRPREYDGFHLTFPGMTPDIVLKPHQKNAVAHILYGNNTLLAHCVGAGKTFEMAAAAMESKRLGLCQKSLFVVPNHLTEQWASDFLQLYPGANILAATRKDFEPANRKKFCSRIATGEYDAVIIGHTQFEKIPLSTERQAAIIGRQIDEIETAIEQAKAENGERYTIKQMEKTRKTLQTRLDRLNDTSRKDDVVTFEQLGVDRLFVDESHYYKNMFLYTKMRNVAGIAQAEAQKSSDMFAKCRYLDEITGGRGITFATGTPISNSMTELYTNMRYLQYDTLQRLGLGHFDSWAAAFGETVTAIELAPEGTGYRAKTRFAKFFNLPELIALFKESADIQTADLLNLPVPEAEYENVVLKPSEYQEEMVKSLAERAEKVRNREVQPWQDNMLKITSDGRKLALDQRLLDEVLPDGEQSKSSACVEKAFQIWEETKAQRSAQLIFCDSSTPKNDGTFNVYDDIKQKLLAKGVPEEEIAFIHSANTETRKTELFAKVRSGQVRFLLGSTQKMGAGTNVQDRLIALHHLDVPWRPSDIEQQEGRILRQGNQNEKVKIFRYVTENTFDSYSWQVIENKQKFISQIMTSKSPVRSCEDVDEAALTYAEVKALATGNPYIKEKMDLDIQVSKLKLLKANHTSQKYRLEDNIVKNYPKQIAALKERVEGLTADMAMAAENIPADGENFSMKVGDRIYADKKEAGAALTAFCREIKSVNRTVTVGEYGGFQMAVSFDSFYHKFTLQLKGRLTHEMEIGTDALGNITRIRHKIDAMPKVLDEAKAKLINVEHQLEVAKTEVEKPFPQEAELLEKSDRLNALNALLNMDEKGEDETIGMETEISEQDEMPDIMPLGDWMADYMVPQFMEEQGVSENRAREMLADAISESAGEILCLSGKEQTDGEEMIQDTKVHSLIAEQVGGNYFAATSSLRGLLIVPKTGGTFATALQNAADKIKQLIHMPGEMLRTQRIYYYDRDTEKMFSYAPPLIAGKEAAMACEPAYEYGQAEKKIHIGRK